MTVYVMGAGPTKSLALAIENLEPTEVAVLSSSEKVVAAVLDLQGVTKRIITRSISDIDEEILNRAESVHISNAGPGAILDNMSADDTLLVAWDDSQEIETLVLDAMDWGFEVFDISEHQPVQFVDDIGDDEDDEGLSEVVDQLQDVLGALERYIRSVVASAMAERDDD